MIDVIGKRAFPVSVFELLEHSLTEGLFTRLIVFSRNAPGAANEETDNAGEEAAD